MLCCRKVGSTLGNNYSKYSWSLRRDDLWCGARPVLSSSLLLGAASSTFLLYKEQAMFGSHTAHMRGKRSMCQKGQDVAWNNEKGEEILEEAEVKIKSQATERKNIVSLSFFFQSWNLEKLFCCLANAGQARVLQFFKALTHIVKKKTTTTLKWLLYVGSAWKLDKTNTLRSQKRNVAHIYQDFRAANGLLLGLLSLLSSIAFLCLTCQPRKVPFLTFKWERFAARAVGKHFNRLAGFISC